MNTTDTREEKGGGEKQHIATLEKIAEERRLSLIGHDPGSETFGRKERKYKRAIKGAEAEHKKKALDQAQDGTNAKAESDDEESDDEESDDEADKKREAAAVEQTQVNATDVLAQGTNAKADSNNEADEKPENKSFSRSLSSVAKQPATESDDEADKKLAAAAVEQTQVNATVALTQGTNAKADSNNEADEKPENKSFSRGLPSVTKPPASNPTENIKTPFSEKTKAIYGRWQHCARDRVTLKDNPVYVPDDSTIVRLQVKDTIYRHAEAAGPGAPATHDHCHDFLRNEIIITGHAEAPSITATDLDGGTFYRLRKGEPLKRIVNSSKVWCLRSPSKTQELYDDEVRAKRKRTERYEKVTGAGGAGDFPKFKVMDIPGRDWTPQTEDTVYRSLSSLPYRSNTYEIPPNLEEGEQDKLYPKCFICHQQFLWGTYPSNSWEVMSDSVWTPTGKKLLKEHCRVEKHELFFFSFNQPIINSRSLTVKMVIQKALVAGFTAMGPLELSLFTQLAEPYHSSRQLVTKLSAMVGFAIGNVKHPLHSRQNSELAAIRKLSPYPLLHWTHVPSGYMIDSAERVLEQILHRLTAFDWVELGTHVENTKRLWNATNLFFKRGVYFEESFLPLSGLEIEDYDHFDALVAAADAPLVEANYDRSVLEKGIANAEGDAKEELKKEKSEHDEEYVVVQRGRDEIVASVDIARAAAKAGAENETKKAKPVLSPKEEEKNQYV